MSVIHVLRTLVTFASFLLFFDSCTYVTVVFRVSPLNANNTHFTFFPTFFDIRFDPQNAFLQDDCGLWAHGDELHAGEGH